MCSSLTLSNQTQQYTDTAKRLNEISKVKRIKQFTDLVIIPNHLRNLAVKGKKLQDGWKNYGP